MSKYGTNDERNDDGTIHHTDWNESGRHSYDSDSDDIRTNDHVTYNDDPDTHFDCDHSNEENFTSEPENWTPESQHEEFENGEF